ncbi:MAG: sialate O-acetylesterase [Bacteroidota bacterium]
MKSILKILYLFIAVTLFSPILLLSQLSVPPIFSDHMVLQQESMVSIWGMATPESKVILKGNWPKAKLTIKSDDKGKWRANIPSPAAGGPYQLTIKNEESELLFQDILFGEVWLCSGQSNMNWSVKKTLTGEKAIAAGEHPQIRVFTVERSLEDAPVKHFSGNWEKASQETVPEFTAVGYYFALQLQEKLNVPVGIIHSSWGGSAVEAWIPPSRLVQLPVFTSDTSAYLSMRTEKRDQTSPSLLFNGMLYPLIPFDIKGVLWYQGEANVGHAQLYQKLFPLMVRSWRETWNIGDFPFYYVQIAPFQYPKREESAAAELREAQWKNQKIRNAGMVVTMDAGDPTNIHPKDKMTVAKRLANMALGDTYNVNDISFQSPSYIFMKKEGDAIRLYFEHTYGSLKSVGESLTDFEIAGEDKVYKPAKAIIEGETVLVSHPDIPEPAMVRYGWENAASPTLMNAADLPASSFRTQN